MYKRITNDQILAYLFDTLNSFDTGLGVNTYLGKCM